MTHPVAPDFRPPLELGVGHELASASEPRSLNGAASRPLSVLVVGAPAEEFAPALAELRQSGLHLNAEHVATPERMRAALEGRAWDLALGDFGAPGLSAAEAVALVREKGIDLPFVVLTASEEAGVAAMSIGVRDYFLHGELGPRFALAVTRELREAADRAQQRTLLERIMLSERTGSMGALAAGFAHEINNPLASIMANLDLAARDVADAAAELGVGARFAEIEEELRDARDATERIRNIARDIKVFSLTEGDNKSKLDVSRVMESALRMAWTELRHRARLVKTYDPAPPVEASESRLGLVLLNLVLNAAQAIAEGSAERHEIRISIGTDARGCAVVEIADTGPGMTQEVLDQLFKPFFSTKPGVGSGLGLPLCRRLLDAIGGTIEVASTPGQGSVFRVRLPAAVPDAVPERVARAAAETAPRGRVMIVDDEPMLARVLQRTLSPDHEVVALTLAADALQRILAGERYDVILCDLMMPQMTGMDLYDEIRRVAHDQAERMVFLTGEAFTPRARAFLEEMPNRRLDKPFDAKDLRALVAEHARSPAGERTR